MKRSDALKLICNQIDFINGNFSGVRDNFTNDEICHADVILTTLEHAGMLPPTKNGMGIPIRSNRDGSIYLELWGWDDET